MIPARMTEAMLYVYVCVCVWVSELESILILESRLR